MNNTYLREEVVVLVTTFFLHIMIPLYAALMRSDAPIPEHE